MRDKIAEIADEKNLNYSLLATPAEGLSGKFTKKDREIFGIIKNITDKDDLMDKLDMGYGSVNHTRTRCMDCGFENSEKDLEKCPECGSTNIDIIQRITGYLVGSVSNWNSGKKAELKDRVTHDI